VSQCDHRVEALRHRTGELYAQSALVRSQYAAGLSCGKSGDRGAKRASEGSRPRAIYRWYGSEVMYQRRQATIKVRQTSIDPSLNNRVGRAQP
jgi:hypothetical protein